jgi:hypothetical protein
MDIQAPYEPGSTAPIYVGGDADAGGRDIVAGSVDAAVAAAKARFEEYQADTYGQGSQIGDVIILPPPPPFEGPYDPATNQQPMLPESPNYPGGK